MEHAFCVWTVYEPAAFADRGHGLFHANHRSRMTPTSLKGLLDRLTAPYKAHVVLLSKQRTESEHTPDTPSEQCANTESPVADATGL